jgi:hypothetical protein
LDLITFHDSGTQRALIASLGTVCIALAIAWIGIGCVGVLGDSKLCALLADLCEACFAGYHE